MAAILSRDEIIRRALRKCGAWNLGRSAPRDREVEEAAYWLDMLLGHTSARSTVWWLVDEDKSIDLTIGTYSYDLTALLGPAETPDGIQFVLQAFLYDVDAGMDVCPLEIVARDVWENRRHRQNAPTGLPTCIYVDRKKNPTMYLDRAVSEEGEYQVRLVCQGYSPDLLNAKPDSKAFTFRPTYNLWIVTALAAQLGSGPIRMLPQDEVKTLQSQANTLRNELDGFEQRARAEDVGQIGYWNGI